MRLNAKITIDKTISVELGRLSFFHGRFKGKPYDENLMLHINKEEYQKYADSMIDHYGVERDRDGKINAFELAMKMDLDIETGAFDRNHSILGAMVFEEKDHRLYDGSSRKWNKKHVMPIVNACAAMARPLEEDGYFGLNSKDDLCDTITTLLRDEPKGLPCWKIASLLCVDKKAIRSILCDNTDRFTKNSIFWRLK